MDEPSEGRAWKVGRREPGIQHRPQYEPPFVSAFSRENEPDHTRIQDRRCELPINERCSAGESVATASIRLRFLGLDNDLLWPGRRFPLGPLLEAPTGSPSPGEVGDLGNLDRS